MPQDVPTIEALIDRARVLDLSTCKMALILNGGAGKQDAESKAAVIREKLAPQVKEFVTHSVTKGSAIAGAARRAAGEGADIVVAFGGDGTQCAVADALAGSETVMAVLPGGTFNYFARDLGVGDTADQAIETILGGHVSRVDVGDVNGRIFLNNAALGVYPEILKRREEMYERWGRSRLAAYWSVLMTIRDLRDPMHLTLTLDGETRDVHTPLAFAARSAFQLENMGLEGAAAVRDGKIALYLAKGHKPRDLFAAAFRLAIGKFSESQDFELLIADDILIETRQRNRLLAFDGEKARVDGPFRIRVHREHLSVIVPDPAPMIVTPEAEAG